MNRWKSFLLITLAVLSVSMPTEAKDEKWERIAATNEEVIYIDTASIKEGPGGSREAWFQHEYNSPNCTSVENQCINEITEHRRLFSDKTACSLFVFISFTDATFSTHNLSCKIEKITSGSVAETIWNRVYR